ncbi:MAG: DnaJ domain-containing protein, partial [Finegoldia magna]|nr:DnaJ domain-containing protein [Finegoldia magna]
HPDINKAADATAKFQEVNNAYDFLSNEQNIERYNRIKNKK